MLKIHKAKLTPLETNSILLPKETGEPLSAAMQNGEPTLWYLFDEDEGKDELVERHFYVAGTGQEMPAFSHYHPIGTCVCLSTPFVWHVFEVFK